MISRPPQLITVTLHGPGPDLAIPIRIPESLTAGQLLATWRALPGALRDVVVEVHTGRGWESPELPYGGPLAAHGVADGAELHLVAVPASIEWLDVLQFLSGSVAGGIAGNFAYDALKGAVLAVVRRGTALDDQAAADVARLATCQRYDLDPDTVQMVDRHRTRKEWTVRLTVSDPRIPSGVLIKATLTTSDPRDTVLVFLPA